MATVISSLLASIISDTDTVGDNATDHGLVSPNVFLYQHRFTCNSTMCQRVCYALCYLLQISTFLLVWQLLCDQLSGLALEEQVLPATIYCSEDRIGTGRSNRVDLCGHLRYLRREVYPCRCLLKCGRVVGAARPPYMLSTPAK